MPFGTLSSHCVNRIVFGGICGCRPRVHGLQFAPAARDSIGKLLDSGRRHRIVRLTLASLTRPTRTIEKLNEIGNFSPSPKRPLYATVWRQQAIQLKSPVTRKIPEEAARSGAATPPRAYHSLLKGPEDHG